MALTQRRVLQILNKGDGSDKTSLACDVFLSSLIILNLLAVCLESIEDFRLQYSGELATFEWFSVMIFLVQNFRV